MKRKFLHIFSITLVILMLSSCSSGSVLKTKEIVSDITQTSVVIESTVKENEEYKNFFKEFSPSFTVPGLFEGVIPQAVCYVEKYDFYVVSGYYEDGTFPSVIMLIDGETEKLVKSFPLKNVDGSDYIGHAGGIACSDEYFFITGESQCYTFSVDKLKKLYNNEPLQFESNFKINTKGSFACFADGILWVGDFVESSDGAREQAENITTLESGETFYAYCEGYILKDGLPDIKKINSATDGYVPDYMLAIPEQVQGMAFTKSGKLVFSTSYGRRNNSYLYIYDDVLLSERVDTITVDSKQLDLLACSSELLKETIIAPPMAEGVVQTTDGLYLIFESGAAKYRNHRGKYPIDTAYKANIE